jgi:hypothetical protein
MAKATGQRIARTAAAPLALTENGPIFKFSSGGARLMTQLSLKKVLGAVFRGDLDMWTYFRMLGKGYKS